MTHHVDFLATTEAMALRRELAAPPGTAAPDPLRLVETLRARLPAESARALAEQIVLERRAWVKFAAPERLLFERVALEQATSPGIARYHAGAVPPGASVMDLGCGLGADAMAFVRAGRRVLAIDRDGDRVRLARHNLLETRPGEGQVAPADGPSTPDPVARALAVQGDAAVLPGRADVLFVDPDRRPGRSRVFTLAEASPAWPQVEALVSRFDAVYVKAPPALPDDEVPDEAAVDFLSEGGECREAFLRFGAGEEPGRVRAVQVDTGAVRDVVRAPLAPVATSGAFLLDPDPALRRAGGVDHLAGELGAARAAARCSYLFAERDPDSPWVRAYRVLEVFPFRRRDLTRRLAAEPPRELIVKQRGVAVAEATLRRGLPRAPDGPRRVVVLWRDGEHRLACLGEPVDPR